MGSLARVHHSMALVTLLVTALLLSQDVEAQMTCSCSEIPTMMDSPGSEMDGSGVAMLNVTVENVSVIVNDECNSFTRIIWTLRGDGVMLSEVNFTITITDSMGSLYRIVNIRANDCMNSTLTCGEHLTEFDYTSIDGLAVNEVYNVSIRTTINEPTMHEVLTPVVSIIENTTIEVPGELSINYTLLGPENRTLVESRSANDTSGLDLVLLDFDIRVFSNDTVYNLSFTQVNDMDIFEEYSITAEVRNDQPLYDNSVTTTVLNVLNITDIIPFANYTLCLRARNCGGLGPEECIILTAPEAAPITPPTDLDATPGMTNVTLMWAAPEQPNGIVTYDYTIINSTDGIVVSGMTMDLSVIVDGLDEFTNYTFEVIARTSVGSNGPARGNFTTLEGVSEAVIDLTVIPNKRSASLEATPPPVTNGIIISYNVSYNVNGSMDIMVMEFNATMSQDLRATVEPLLPFTTYVFSVAACTSVGCGPFSVPEIITTLEDAPSVPRNLMVTINNSTSVTLTWQTPAMLNGIIQSYTITILDNNMNTVQSQTLTNLTDLTYVITQLTHNTSYTVNVSGVTVGTGAAASETFTTPALPTIPLNVTATTGDMLRTLIVQWEPPSSPGGVITTYMVTYDDTTVDNISNDTTYTITGLEAYTNYSITVIACTSNGCGNESDIVIGTTEEEASSPPLNVNATTINATAVQVTWSPPDMLNGIIRYYTVIYGIDGSSETEELNSTDTTAVVTDLDPFTTYEFYVVAFTVDLSNLSESDTAMTDEAAPSAPLNVTARNDSSTSILVTWVPPMTPNGMIRSYRVEFTRMNDSNVDDVTTDNIATSVIIGMLEKFTTYEVQVFATTVEEGDGSEIVTVTTDEDTPGIPGDLFVNEINSTAITVSWNEPLVTNGIITMYEIFYSVGNHTVLNVDNDTMVLVNATNTSAHYEVAIHGLDHFTTYTVAVRAYTRIGPGNLTDTFSILTDPFSSSPPQNFTVVVLSSTKVELSWEYPESPNGEIQGYSILSAEPPAIEQVIMNITLAMVNDDSNQTAVVNDLTPFTWYSFRVRAFSFGDPMDRPNLIHIGIASNETIVRTDEDVPEAPTNFNATAVASTMVYLSWGIPDVTNGIILYYTVEYYNTTDTLMMIYGNDTFDGTITGLNEDTLYSFVIYANTSAGAGPNATDSDVTFEDRPSAAPQNINTMVINSSAISVSWYPPPFLDQNGDIIGYQLMITNQNRSNSSVMVVNVTNETSYIATMLQEFEVYSFEIAAQTAIGLGPFSDAVSNQTFEDVPTDEPQNVTIFEISSQSFMLSWDPPPIGEQNGILIHYHVIVIETEIHYTDDGTEIIGMETYLNRTYNVSEGRTQLIDMLHPDYNYTVRIAAATEPGIGPFSDPVTVRTNMDVPTEAPQNVTVTVESSRSIMLTWERPPLEEENGLLVDYHVIVTETQIHYTDNGTEITGMQRYLNTTYDVSEGRMQLINESIHPDYNYTVRIAAATQPGIGPFSDDITVRTTMDVPTEVPQNVTVTVESSRSIVLTWERPPLEEENGLLVDYHVIVIETQIHYFDNGTEITGMQRYLNTTYDVSEGRMQLINESIHPDYNYTVRIAAATQPGIGPFSDEITVRTNMDAPTEAPRNVNLIVVSSHSLLLEWERPPLEEENGLLVRYHVIVMETQIHYTDDGTEITGMETYLNTTYNVSECRTQLIDGLHPDYNYTVRIAAATEPGIGPFSDEITNRTDMDVPTEAPRNVTVTVNSSRSIVLTWERPSLEEENGLLVRYHVIVIETQIHYMDNGTEITRMGTWFNSTYEVSEGRMQAIDGLHPDYNYTVRIAAATEPGIGPFSDAITVRTNMDVPTEVPQNVTVTVESSHSIMLTWKRPPLEEENGLLVDYHVIVIETQIHYTDNGTEITGMETYLNQTYNVSEGRMQAIDGLHPDYNYTVRIAAATEPGIGPFSDTITVRTEMDVPTEVPQNFTVTVESSRSIMLTWERPPLEEENGLLVDYHVIVMETQIHYMDNGTEITGMQRYLNATYDVSEGRMQLINESIHPDYNYTVRIAAATEPGIGPFSDPVTVRTEMDIPTEAPRNVTVTVESSRSIMLTWERPPLEEENGLLVDYHVIVIETQIHYMDNGTEITGIQRYLNTTYNVSEGRMQLINESIHPDYNYTVRIAAATEPGIGPFSDDITVRTEMDVPTEVPQNVTVTVESSRSIMLTWERPPLEEENGLLVDYHVIVIETQIHYTDNGTEITGMQRYLNTTYDVSEGRMQLINESIHPDYNYTVRIAAATEPGIGPFSDEVTVRTIMDVPTEVPQNVTVTVESSRSIMLIWERPPLEEENGLLVEYHVIVIETQIHYFDNGTEITGMQRYLNTTYDVSEGRMQLINESIHPDYNYTVRIAAATQPGIGPFSDEITVRTNMDVPTEVPQNVTVTVESSRSIMLIWERPPLEEENGLLVDYHVIVIETQIHYMDNGTEITGIQRYLNTTYNVSEGRMQLINESIHPDYNYTVRIAAATQPGIGPFSDEITVRTNMDVPTEVPQNVTVTVESSRSIMLTWERPPLEEENGLLVDYHVIVIETQIHYMDNGTEITGMQRYLNTTYDVSEGRMQLINESIHPDYNYTVRIAAATEPGIGPFSDPVTVRTIMDVPTEVPQNVTVTVESSRSIMLIWERPPLEEENGLLVDYHVIVIETQIHYMDNGTEITGIQRYLNTTYNVSEGRMQLINESIHPDYNYTVRIAAATQPGIGPFSDEITVRTNMDVPTEVPQNVTVTVESSRSIMLTWERPPLEEENGLLVDYHVIVIETQIHYMDNGTEITGMQRYLNTTYDVSEGRMQLINESIHPDYNYTVRIAAATEPGIGPFSDPVTVRTIMDVPTEVPQNVTVTVESSRSIMLIWERPPLEEENGLLVDYHVIVIETQIHYFDNGTEITGMQRYLNTTYDVSEGRMQLINESIHPDYNYTVRIAAATQPGIGPFSDEITVRTNMDVPTEVPQNVTVTVESSRSIMLTWERPSLEEENGLLVRYHVIVIETQIHYFDNGTEITGMQRYLNTTYDVSEGRMQLMNESIHPDYNYTVRIAAATEPGIGPFSDPVTVRTNMDVPTEVPQNVTVTVESSRSIMLTWERPSLEEENGLLVDYHVIVIETQIHYFDNGTEITGMQRYLNTTYDVSEGRMQLINESIHPDYNYTVRIAAATQPGIGPFSDEITVRTNMDVPTEVPQNVTVTVESSHSIMLTWERPPLEEENGLLVRYHVIVIETQIHYFDNGTELRGMNRFLNTTYDVSERHMQVIDNLHPDYNYTVRIAAATKPGIGPFSDAITVRTNMDVPTEVPQNVTVTVESSRSIMLTWERPSLEEENGLLVDYHVIVIETQIHYMDNGTEITGMQRYLNTTYDVSEGRMQLINESIHPDYNYTVRIAAATEPGIGPFSDPVTVRTIMDVPTEVPQNVTVTVESSRSIMLTWERPPLEQENGLLECYHVIVIETQIHYFDNGTELRGMNQFLNRTYNVSEGRMQLISDLHPDYNYTVRIAAATEPGIGPFSDPVIVRTTMDVPTEVPQNVIVTVESSRSIMLTWERPPLEEENGLLVDYHVIVIETQIHYMDNGTEITGMETYLNQTYNVSEGRMQLINESIHPDYNYTVRIAAATEPGIGPFSDEITVRTNMDVPTEVPGNVSVTVNSSRSIMLTWERPPPEEENGLLLVYHVIVIETQIYYLDNGTVAMPNETYLNTTYNVSEGRTQLIDELHPDYDYTVRIAAATEPGIGPFSDEITVRTYMDVPDGPPQNFNVTPINYTTVYLSWDRPMPTVENGILTMYTIVYNGSRVEKQPGDVPDKIEHYGKFTIQRDANLSREFYITNMSTLVSNSEYHFQIAASTVNGSGPFSDLSIEMIEQGTPSVPTDPPQINPSPNVSLPENYPSDPIGHNTLTFVLPLPPEDDGELTEMFIIVQEPLKDSSDPNTLRSIGTWYEAFNTANNPQRGFIPPAYIALEITQSAIEATRFKRDMDGYILNRFVRQTSSGNLAIRLGNESCRPINKTICNGELKPNTNYSVAYNACTIGGCAVSPLSAPLLTDPAPEEEDTDNTGLIIGIVVGAVGGIVTVIIIIAIIWYCRRRSKRQKYLISNIRDRSGGTGLGSIKGKHTKRNTKSSSLLLPHSPVKKNGSSFETTEPVGPTIVPVKEQPSTYTSDDLTAQDNSRRIYLRDLPAHVADMSNDSGYKFSEEYERVSEVGLDQTKEASLMAENRAKNRYTNILSYDHSRTKLSFVDDEPGSDYINANYIPGYKMKRAYIATQGPLPCTFDDFWRMVWEQNVHTIVMLTQLVERGRNKCHHYWPGMEPSSHGEVSIVMQSEKENEHWTAREFVLTHEKKERVVTQFQFTGWPDHGVPDNPGPVIEFVRSVRAQNDPESNNRGPMVVHCSAGVGRTGTFIALDTLLQHINDHDWVDIFNIACEMRQHRNHMVQTEAQYIFIHKALQEVVESRSTFRYSVYRKSYSESDDNKEQLSPVMVSTKM